VGFKKERLGPRLVEAARSGERYRDVHVFLGGTGAVGGTALLQMLSMYEEMFAVAPPGPDDVPILVATGTSRDDIASFTRRLFRLTESKYGPDRLPMRVRSGYLTASGVFLALERFAVAPLPGSEGIATAPPDERPGAVRAFLAQLGAEGAPAFDVLHDAIGRLRPFTSFLEGYRRDHLQDRPRYRSILLGIPIPSLIAYQQDALLHIAEHAEGLTPEHIEELKETFARAIRDDLLETKSVLADTVLVAHTTGVGGMYDDDVAGGAPSIRLGFAHAAQDRALAEKAVRANELTDLYSGAGIDVLITAAAIGVDEVRVHEQVPLHREIRQILFESPAEVFPGSKGSQPAETGASRRAGRTLPARQVIRSFPPLTVPLDDPPSEPVTFERGEPVVPTYTIRSGENGFFSVANADALYRVMRVASASELGMMLATVGLLGDDRLDPWFRDHVCYYPETDNSRTVFDFLRQPALLASELSGLDPMALQDLGSAKHQGEMHTLGLLILLHRLRTLDVDAIDPYVELEGFDPSRFLVEHSRALTFEDIASWEFEALARDVTTLVAADAPDGLLPLTPPREHGLFPRRREALRRVLERGLRAVWTVPSLGSPIVYERDGVAWVRAGYFVAPMRLLVTTSDAIARSFRRDHEAVGAALDDVRDYHLAVGGFVDVRPHAIVCDARAVDGELAGHLARFTDEEALRKHLFDLEPYSFFSTCGLLAVWFRLRGLYAFLRESMIELGTLHEFRWTMPRDPSGHLLVVPGVVEAFRMVSEGLEKTTGTERLDGFWGYERREAPDRRGQIPGVRLD
jgi:hypothetical protein